MPSKPTPPRPKAPSDSEFGDIVRDRAWQGLKATFEPWAREREEVLRGYRMREIRITYQHSEPLRRRHLERAETESFDPGRLRAASALRHMSGGGPGEVRVGIPAPRPPAVVFTAGLPTPYLIAHPEAEAVVREAIAYASEVTGLDLRVGKDVRGGSNWVIEGALSPTPAPAVPVEDEAEPEEAAGFRP